MNDFLLCELIDGRLPVMTDLTLFDTELSSIRAIIDTGCSYSSFNYKQLFGLDDDKLRVRRKALDIETKRPYKVSYGVESSGTYKRELQTYNDKISLDAIKFQYKVNLILNSYSLGIQSIYLNYNRRGTNLIGLDLLSKMDFYVGLSHITGTIVFIGVLREQKDKSDYYTALKGHFGLAESQSFFADLFRNFRR